MLWLSPWIAGWNVSRPPSRERRLWKGSRMSAECWSSAAEVTSSCMLSYGDTAATVPRTDTPPTFSSYAMKAWEMCLNCSSTWLRPCADE